jgi:hypothetical protein
MREKPMYARVRRASGSKERIILNEREIRLQLGFKEEIIYHYCSIESLFSIISSQCIWLTSLESTNDIKELKFGQKILNDALKEMISEEHDTDMKKILEKILSAPSDEEYKKYRADYHYYGASFVNHADSLTHWERYGNGGSGVCIAFNIWMIQNYFECRSIPNVSRSWLWHDNIIYNEIKQKEFIKKHISSMIDSFLSIVDTHKILYACNTIYYGAIAKVKPLFKHSGFSDENECRLIFEEGQAEKMSDYHHQVAPKTDNVELFLKMSEQIKDSINELNLSKKINVIV